MVQYQPYADIDVCSIFSSDTGVNMYVYNNSYHLIPPTCRCKITRTKKVTDLAMSVAILATYGLSYCVLTAGPELVKYDGHVVTVESLPLLQGHSAAATDKGVHKEDMQKSRG